ncbi:MAG: SIMPL domain-containing protein [Archaeoglobaceae archaeon]|nr:SIMPL domain-containing protein [Archaeoglobaceae archaeon]
MKKAPIFFILSTLFFLLLTPAALAAEKTVQHTVTVTGHAETSVTPELAIATFGIVSVGNDVEQAKRANDQVMQKIMDGMLLMGIERSKVKTSMFSVQPIYRSESASGTETITGYRVQNNITVTIEDMRKVSRVIDAAFAGGANQFQGIRFGLKQEQSLHDDLLKQALLDGKSKASLIAETLGEKLGRPVSISESAQISPVLTDSVRFSKSMPASTTPLAAGSMTAVVDVLMVFELE